MDKNCIVDDIFYYWFFIDIIKEPAEGIKSILSEVLEDEKDEPKMRILFMGIVIIEIREILISFL